MVSTPTSLGGSPGWTKGDHRKQKHVSRFDAFPINFYLEQPRVSNQDRQFKDNTKYYSDCHRNILNSFTSNFGQMSFPGLKQVGHIYHGKPSLLDIAKTESQFKQLLQTNTMTELSTQQKMIKAAYMKYLDTEADTVDSYSTMKKYTDQLTQHFKNPETTEEPPHFQDALQRLSDYTS
jgi:hypothetical protein